MTTKKWDANPMRETRRKLRLSQEAMAYLLGCSVLTVSRHERRPDHYTVDRWRLALKRLLDEQGKA